MDACEKKKTKKKKKKRYKEDKSHNKMHYESMPIQIYWKILPPKKWKFSDKKKNSDIFQISAQNIDCEYSLEPPRWGGSNEYTIYVFEQKKEK